MSPPNPSAQSFAPPEGAPAAMGVTRSFFEEDIALGCECAYPALQIEAWGADADAQPLQKFN